MKRRTFVATTAGTAAASLMGAAPAIGAAGANAKIVMAVMHVYLEKPCSHNPREGEWMIAAFKFAGGKAITWEASSCNRQRPGERGESVWFYGDGGSLVFGRDGYRLFDEKQKEIEFIKDGNGQPEHLANFVDAVRGNAALNANIDVAHRSTLLCHLGNIAYRTGRALACDPKDGTILNDDEAMAFWEREYEPGWKPEV